MGDVEHVPNFRGWVDSILKIAPMEARTWKSISLLNGWKVKTHGMYFLMLCRILNSFLF